MTAIGYCRVSTRMQADDGVSLRDQEKKIRGYCELYGIELLDVIVDAGISAKNLKRPGAQRVLQMVADGSTEAVVIAKLDRLTRSVKDLAATMELFNHHGCSLISVSESLDTSSAAGRMVVNMLGVISQWEREVIGERVSAAIQYKKGCGESYSGRYAPYGYQRLDGKLVPVEDEQKAIQIIVGLHNCGSSVVDIVREMNQRTTYKSRASAMWGRKTVAKIIHQHAATPAGIIHQHATTNTATLP